MSDTEFWGPVPAETGFQAGDVLVCACRGHGAPIGSCLDPSHEGYHVLLAFIKKYNNDDEGTPFVTFVDGEVVLTGRNMRRVMSISEALG